MVKMIILIVFCSLITSSVETNEVSVIQALSNHIGEMVLDCQTELEFTNEVIGDLLDFWNKKNFLRSQDLGCALVCVFEKNEFLNEEGSQVVAGNVNAFYRACGADELMSQHMVELFQLCKKSTKSISNLCDSALETAKCFRYGIHEMHWAPEPDYWKNQIDLPSGFEPVPISNDQNGERLEPTVIRKMSQRKLFATLFRSCRK